MAVLSVQHPLPGLFHSVGCAMVVLFLLRTQAILVAGVQSIALNVRGLQAFGMWRASLSDLPIVYPLLTLRTVGGVESYEGSAPG